MKTRATVLSVNGKYATVQTERTSACEGCHKAAQGESCSVCSLMGSQRKIEALALNTVNAGVGDAVWIESKTSRMLWYALLVFVFPILAALLAAALASLFSKSGAVLLASGGAAFVLAFVAVFVYSRIVEKTRCDIEITEVILPEEK